MHDANYLCDTIDSWQRAAERVDALSKRQRGALRRELRQFAAALHTAIEGQLAGVAVFEPLVREAAERERRRVASRDAAVSTTLELFADGDRALLARYAALLTRIDKLVCSFNEYCARGAIERVGELKAAGFAARPLPVRCDQ